MNGLLELLASSPLLLLMAAMGLGALAGKLRIAGSELGPAAVIFCGIALGAVLPKSETPHIPPVLGELGLVLFVYMLGISVAPGFFTAFRRDGLRASLYGAAVLAAGAAAMGFGGRLLGLDSATVAGTFCGALMSTPALAAVTQTIYDSGTDPGRAMNAALGYSMAYIPGLSAAVLAMILAGNWGSRSLKAERTAALEERPDEPLAAGSFRVTNPALFGRAIGELRVRDETGVIISRIRHSEETEIPRSWTVVHEGDILTAVGTQSALRKARTYFGETSSEHLQLDQRHVAQQRYVVSDPKIVGLPLEKLYLEESYGATATRLRRGDFEFLPRGDTILQFGDRVRVVSHISQREELAELFGNSEDELGTLEILTLAGGIALGLLVAFIPFPGPQGTVLTLGIAGGPLLVALVLGRLGRTGPLVWSLPPEPSLAIRQLGLALFLGTVGVNAGGRFLSALQAGGIQVLTLALVVAVMVNTLALLGFRFLLRHSTASSMGYASAIQTQPATLVMARQMAGLDQVLIAYAAVYPVAVIAKILLAQFILLTP